MRSVGSGDLSVSLSLRRASIKLGVKGFNSLSDVITMRFQKYSSNTRLPDDE